MAYLMLHVWKKTFVVRCNDRNEKEIFPNPSSVYSSGINNGRAKRKRSSVVQDLRDRQILPAFAKARRMPPTRRVKRELPLVQTLIGIATASIVDSGRGPALRMTGARY